MIAPALEEIAGTMNGKVKIVKLNVDENPATAAKYGIMSIPTLMLFKNGELASRQVGAAPKQKLEQWITGSGLTLAGHMFCERPANAGRFVSGRRRAVRRQHLARKIERAGDQDARRRVEAEPRRSPRARPRCSRAASAGMPAARAASAISSAGTPLS